MLPEGAGHALSGDAFGGSVYAPIADPAVFRQLLGEAAALAVCQQAPDLLVITDSGTFGTLENAEAVTSRAGKVVVIKELGDNLPAAPDKAGGLNPGKHVLVLLSSDISLALYAFDPAASCGGPYRDFSGGWTVLRSAVIQLARRIVGPGPAAEFIPDSWDETPRDCMTAALMRMSMLCAGTAEKLDNTLLAGRGELLTVLEILKAISSKRQTHDILFVFVEQVAKIVETRRCSVVRVWDSTDHAHVLASHEDSSVYDRRIMLEKYPEVRLAVQTGKKVVVNDVHSDPLTADASELMRKAGIDALVVIPIICRDPEVGTLLLRAARRGRGFSFREISFFEVVAEAASSALEKAQLLESVQRANARLEHLAITDALTGLYNRRYFQDRMDQEVERALRYGLPLSCLMLDVDNFKKVNDTWGHLTGDAVLRAIAGRMQASSRKVDLIARYGGEEFVVILPQTGGGGAVSEAERMRRAIGDSPIDTLTGPVSVTASIGAAVFEPQRMRTTNDLVGLADEALHRAKDLGKNRVVLADNMEGRP